MMVRRKARAMPGQAAARPISFLTTVAFAVALAALLLIALFPIFPRQFSVHVGDTASRTVKSPKSVSFESAFLTAQKRDEAAAAVPASLAFDPTIRNGKLAEFDRVTSQISQIRGQSTDADR